MSSYIVGTGLHLPPHSISNQELADSYNRWAATRTDVAPSDPDFMLKASGIRSRHVLEKDGVLDPARMVPSIPPRPDDALSVQAEFGVASALLALEDAGRDASEIDMIICAAAQHQRPYPAIAIEIQEALGATGAGFDMNVACSSMTFAMHTARQMLEAGAARNVLVVTPEIMSGHLNWRDRESHFIFGDASTSVVLSAEPRTSDHGTSYEVLHSTCLTEFSSNIRSNFGFLNRTDPATQFTADKLVTQSGRAVFRDVSRSASQFILDHLQSNGVEPRTIGRYWLHQANRKMIDLIMRTILGGSYDPATVPIVLDRIGNVASPGSIIAFHETRNELSTGDRGLICSFGAGYSIGSLLVQRVR